MSKLLIHEAPLQILPTLALKLGLNEAIVLQLRSPRCQSRWFKKVENEATLLEKILSLALQKISMI